MHNLATESEITPNNYNSFKYLYKDYDTGKMMVTDNNNYKYESDIYGRKLKSFLPKISGILTGSNRSKIKMNISKSLNNISKNGVNSINSINNINLLVSVVSSQYFLSKPISTPFYNEENANPLFKKIKNKLSQNLSLFYNKENNKFQKNNEFRISYLNKNISNNNNGNSLDKKDEDKIILLINKSIDELKQ